MGYVSLGLLFVCVLLFARGQHWKNRCHEEEDKLVPLYNEAVEQSRLANESQKELAETKDTILKMASRPVIAMMSNDQMSQLAHIIMSGLKPKEWIN
jgi:hypothetical protein